jgi:hypothetical protein
LACASCSTCATGSGANNQRPGLVKVLEAAQCGDVNAVLVWKLDRFGRSAFDLLGNSRWRRRGQHPFILEALRYALSDRLIVIDDEDDLPVFERRHGNTPLRGGGGHRQGDRRLEARRSSPSASSISKNAARTTSLLSAFTVGCSATSISKISMCSRLPSQSCRSASA